ncbi:MAG: hypothetical protein Q9P90_12490 [candidate division KSB1 bacterium]|nr:hypothetical protein [candidate division KSB1 bacterium]
MDRIRQILRLGTEDSLRQLHEFFQKMLGLAFYDLNLQAHRDAHVYLADRLTFFARTDHLYRIKSLPDWKLETVVEILLQLESARQGDILLKQHEEWLVLRHIGDFTLFMTGMFREYVQRIGVMDFYQTKGKEAYADLAGHLGRGGFQEEERLFSGLNQYFELYTGAIDYMKKVYFHYEPIDRMLKSVIDALSRW